VRAPRLQSVVSRVLRLSTLIHICPHLAFALKEGHNMM
jgi:hypothetical protein